MQFKNRPFDHQKTAFEKHRDTAAWAYFWEQGTGKTFQAINEAAWNYLKGRVDAMLIVAPNGVHFNWANTEIPEHLPVQVEKRSRVFTWNTGRSGSREHTKAAQDIIKFQGFAIAVMSYDSLLTEKGKAFAKEFLKSRKVFYVLDEVTRIKSPSAKRTKTIVQSGRFAVMKRILTGTPIANSPFDVYTPIKFLDIDFWKPHGMDTFAAFKATFGIFKPQTIGGNMFQQVVGYRNLPALRAILGTISSRVTKDEVLDLPPKVYKRRPFEISPEQQKLYTQLKNEFMLWLDSGETVTAALVVTRLLRLQQITSGFLPVDGDDPDLTIPGSNRRLEALLDELEECEGKVIVWARFRRDLDIIADALTKAGITWCRYDGSTSDEDREKARTTFQQPDGPRVFLGNPAAAGEGLTLHAASTVIYYSNSFNLSQRLQSEDRAHRIGQTKSVTYIDLCAVRTVDEHIVKKLRAKKEVAAVVTGDEVREWL